MAKKGITGRVAETGQSFTIRDDYDYANPGQQGKGYHVNVQVGKEDPRAYCGFNDGFSDWAYTQRVQMTGERHQWDGPEKAAKWYVNCENWEEANVIYREKK